MNCTEFMHHGLKIEVDFDPDPSGLPSPREFSFFNVAQYGRPRETMADESFDDYVHDIRRPLTIDCPACHGFGVERDRLHLYRTIDGKPKLIGAGSTRAMELLHDRIFEREGFTSSVWTEESPCLNCESEGNIVVTLVHYVKHELNARIALPLWGYSHGNVMYAVGDSNPFSCPWDSGPAGVVYATREKLVQYGLDDLDDETLIKYIKNDIDTYNKWANGESYFYKISNRLGDELDSCYGFFNHDEAVDQAKTVAENLRNGIDRRVMEEMVVLGEN